MVAALSGTTAAGRDAADPAGETGCACVCETDDTDGAADSPLDECEYVPCVIVARGLE